MSEPVFKIVLEGNVDSDNDGNPDVTFDVDFMGFDVARFKQNVGYREAMKLFATVVSTVKGFFG